MEKGTFIRVNYIGRLESGEIFDLTDEVIAKKEGVYNTNIKYKPIPVIVGAGFLIPGLDHALEKMQVGEGKTIDVKPEEGFGQRDARLVKVVPKKTFDNQAEPRVGMIVDFSGMKGRIQSVEAGRIRIDFNNPLAGKTLKYEIEITKEITDIEEKIEAVLEFFGADKAEIEIEEKSTQIKTKLPDNVKEKVSSLIFQYVKEIEKVNFLESYSKT